MTAQTTAQMTPCHHCGTPKPLRRYLCGTCWWQLPDGTRRLLGRRDKHAGTRLRELYAQIDADVPLPEIRVSP